MKIPLMCFVLFATVMPVRCDTPGENGRYQLAVGKLDLDQIIGADIFATPPSTKVGAVTINTVFKIDTQTGEVWYLQKARMRGDDNSFLPIQVWVRADKNENDKGVEFEIPPTPDKKRN